MASAARTSELFVAVGRVSKTFLGTTQFPSFIRRFADGNSRILFQLNRFRASPENEEQGVVIVESF
jgi:hypothetical protein